MTDAIAGQEPDSTDFAYWLTRWNDSRSVSAARQRADATRIERHILPMIKRHDVRKMVPEHIENWVEALLAKGVGVPTAHASLLVVRQALDLAKESGVIPRNPARGVRVPGATSVRRPDDAEILTEDQLQRILTHADRYFRAMILFGARTGARWEEVLGVKVEDLLLDDALVRVGGRRIIRDANNQLVAEENVKDNRLVPLSPDLVSELRIYLELTRGWREYSSYVFLTKRSHTHPTSTNFNVFVLRPALRGAGLDERAFVFHSLRHTAAANFIREGVDDVRLQRIMGYKYLNTMQLTYKRFFEEYEQAQEAKG